MTDVVDAKTRSRMMAGIRGKNTRPEVMVRKALFRAGFRYRLHDRQLPGRPDLVLKKYNAVILVNGCFWHRHRCHLFKWPGTRKEFWRDKLNKNVRVDRRNIKALAAEGWRVLVIWECAIKGSRKKTITEIMTSTTRWLVSRKKYLEISSVK